MSYALDQVLCRARVYKPSFVAGFELSLRPINRAGACGPPADFGRFSDSRAHWGGSGKRTTLLLVSCLVSQLKRLEENDTWGGRFEPAEEKAILDMAVTNRSRADLPFLCALAWTGLRSGRHALLLGSQF